MKNQGELRDAICGFAQALGVSESAIEVKVISSNRIVAGAIGVCLPRLGNILPDIAIGQISLAKPLLQILGDRELEYVLAHETVHIVKNHLLSSGMIKLIKESIKHDNPELRKIMDLAEVVLTLFGTPVEAAVTKQQEIEADVYAICLIGSKRPAISCLTKLVAGDLSEPSHVWEALGVNLPVMTMQDRIREINARIDELEQLGCRLT